jgi:hypothetical protein
MRSIRPDDGEMVCLLLGDTDARPLRRVDTFLSAILAGSAAGAFTIASVFLDAAEVTGVADAPALRWRVSERSC